MNENNCNTYDGEMEIDLIDMTFFLMKKWKGLIAALIVGILLGTGIYMLKVHQAKSAMSELQESSKAEFDEEKYDISKETQFDMNVAYQYRKLYETQLAYNDNSILMSLNPNNVYKGEVKYNISAGENTGLIGNILKNVIENEDLLEEMSTASGLKLETPYIREVVSSETANEKKAVTDEQEESDDMIFAVNNTCVAFQVISKDKGSCEKMVSVLQKWVEQAIDECKEQYGDFEAVKVLGGVNASVDSSYFTKQKDNVEQLKRYYSDMTDAEKAFTGDEEIYYTHKYIDQEDTAKTEKVEELKENEISVSRIKWLVVGIFLMCIVWCGYYISVYFFDRKVKTLAELRETYRLPVIGYLTETNQTSRRVDGWIDALYRKVKEQPNTIQYVENALNSMDKYVLCGDVSLAKELKLKSTCIYRNDFSYRNSDTLNQVKETGREVLLVQIGKTTRSEIERELECCRLQKVKVEGVIAVEA